MNEALKLDYIWYLLVYDFPYLGAGSGGELLYTHPNAERFAGPIGTVGNGIPLINNELIYMYIHHPVSEWPTVNTFDYLCAKRPRDPYVSQNDKRHRTYPSRASRPFGKHYNQDSIAVS